MRFDHYTRQAAEAVLAAEALATFFHNSEIFPEHLLLALLEQTSRGLTQLLDELGVTVHELQRRVELDLGPMPTTSLQEQDANVLISRRLGGVLAQAEEECRRQGEDAVSTLHLFLAILDEPRSRASGHLSFMGVTRTRVLRVLQRLRRKERNASEDREGGTVYETTYQTSTASQGRRSNRSHAESEEPSAVAWGAALALYTRDLTQMAEDGVLDPVVGRDDEIRWMMQILGRRNKNNPLLVGTPGVGRTAILHGLAWRIVQGDVPSHLQRRRLAMLDFGSLLAGAKYRGEFEERFKALLHEVEASKGEIILVLPDIHNLVGAGGGQSGVGAANLLKPALLRGELHAIGTSTIASYRKQVEKDQAFKRLFQDIWVEEPHTDECVAILRGLKSRYEIHHGVRIADAALQTAVQLSSRYIADRSLPDKAIDLVDEAASRLRLAIESMPSRLDDLNRRVVQLKIEEQALRKETDVHAQTQLRQIQEDILQWQEKFAVLRAQWEREKRAIVDIRVLKEKIEQLEHEEAEAERAGLYERAAEIKYSQLQQMRTELQHAEDILEEAGEQRLLKEVIDAEDIAEVVADWTGIPVSRMLESERAKLIAMEQRLAERVIGQPDAIRAVSEAVRRSRSGLADPKRPIGSFLFLGPTGVGKTELAKALAEFLFDDERAMVRIDMSELMEKHAVSRLVGSPPGYSGHEEGGQLTEAVRQRPYTVVLFDEVEKAHQDVFNIMLQMLDDGHLTDGQGRTVDFKNTVVILTSNLGAEAILGEAAEHPAQLRALVEEQLRAHFRPEFLNRIDETLIFQRLTLDVIQVIAAIQLERLQRLLQERSIQLDFTPAARVWLAEMGYDPAFGARPLRRAILQYVQNPLSMELLENRFQEGDTIMADLDPSRQHLRFAHQDPVEAD